LDQCFTNDVVIVGNWSSYLLKNQYYENWNLLALLDVNNTKVFNETKEIKVKYYSEHPSDVFFRLHPARTFIVAEIELRWLKLALHTLTESIWWNVYTHRKVQ